MEQLKTVGSNRGYLWKKNLILENKFYFDIVESNNQVLSYRTQEKS